MSKNHNEQKGRVKELLEHIAASRRDFQREISSRKRLLETLEPQPPADPILAGIDDAWARLSTDYHRYRQQAGEGRIEAMRQKRVELEAIDEEERRYEQLRQARRDEAIREKAARLTREKRRSPHGRR